jgi:hypothetical protein
MMSVTYTATLSVRAETVLCHEMCQGRTLGRHRGPPGFSPVPDRQSE